MNKEYIYLLPDVFSYSTNNIYGKNRKTFYMKPNPRQMKDKVITMLKALHSNKPIITTPCKLTINHYRKRKNSVDVMNLEKIIADALTEARVWQDDKLVYQFCTSKVLGYSRNIILIKIETNINQQEDIQMLEHLNSLLHGDITI